MFDEPHVDETFGQAVKLKEEGEDEKKVNGDEESDEEDPMRQDEQQKAEIIRTFALNQIASIPIIFKGHVTSEILTSLIKLLVTLNYFSKDTLSEDLQKLASFKLYGLI